jgi:ribosomal protein S18 acetylase RimI-like enzyme
MEAVMAGGASTTSVVVRPLDDDDDARTWAAGYLAEHWGSEIQVAHGEVQRPAEHDGLVAEVGGERCGLLTYRIGDDAGLEVTTLHARLEGRGVGSALLHAAVEVARRNGCPRLWLITTNDNLRALAFYQRRGLRLVALRPGAVDGARAIKPEIPLRAANGIPIRDELELEIRLQ